MLFEQINNTEELQNLLNARPDLIHCIDRKGNKILHIAETHHSDCIIKMYIEFIIEQQHQLKINQQVSKEKEKERIQEENNNTTEIIFDGIRELMRHKNKKGQTAFDCALSRRLIMECCMFFQLGAELSFHKSLNFYGMNLSLLLFIY